MGYGVLVDGTPLATEHRFRGVGRYVEGLLKGLEGIGYGFRTLSQSRGIGLYGRAVSATPASVTITRPLRPRLRFDWIWNELWLRREIEGLSPGLYHATDLTGVPISPRFKTVATVYDLIPLTFPPYLDKLSRDQRLGYRRSLEKLRRADHLIAISEFTKEDVVSRLGVDPERVTAIPLAVDPKAFAVPRQGMAETLRERHRLPERFVLYVGSLEEHKRVPLAIEAAARAATPLVIVGRHSTDQQRQLAQTVKRLRADSYVRYLGYVSGEDLAVLYRDARAFLFPSVYEGFGLPVLEAMALRCPVVTTSAASLPEVAGDATLVVPPDDVEALAEAVSVLAEDEDLRDKLIESGVARASSFTWEKTAEKTVEVYDRMLTEKQ